MPAPPARNEISDAYPNPSNAVMRVGMGRLWDYVTSFLGLTGSAADARTALGVPAETDAMLLGNPVASTQSPGNSSTRLCTTDFANRVLNGVTSVSVAGAGDITLSATQCGTGILILTGALTGNRTVIVPTRWRQIVENATSGAFALTVKTASGTGINVTQGKQKELFSDGAAVLEANNDLGGLQPATQAQLDAGASDTVAATPLKLKNGFAISLTANGYIKLPSWLGGWVVQWGSVSATMTHSSNYSATFPMPFPTSCLRVLQGVGSTISTGAAIVYSQFVSNTLTTATFQYGASNGAAYATTINYIAVGN